MDIAALDGSHGELVEHLRALRRFSRGVVRAYVTLVCHSRNAPSKTSALPSWNDVGSESGRFKTHFVVPGVAGKCC
jgi:hypothetical protein